MKNKLKSFAPIFTLIILIGCWYVVAMSVNATILVPTPHKVFISFGEILGEISFYKSIISSVGRTFISFLIGFILGVMVAIVAGISSFFEKLFYPIIILVRATPTMSIIFLCIIWFNSQISPMVVCLTVIFPLFYSSTLQAIKSVDKNLIEMSNFYKITKRQQILWLYLPAVASRLFADSISILAFNVKLMISAEALSRTQLSLGREMAISKESLETARLICYALTAVALSYVFEIFLKAIKKLIDRWRYVEA